MRSIQPRITERHERLRPVLVAYFRRRLRNQADAEDLTQEVFFRLARGEASVAQAPDAYVFRIAANLLRDHARREKVRHGYREAKLLEGVADHDPLDPFRVVAARHDLMLLSNYITELPEKTRRIFILYRMQGIDKPAIAEAFGLSVRMVEIHIRKALTLLYERMEGHR